MMNDEGACHAACLARAVRLERASCLSSPRVWACVPEPATRLRAHATPCAAADARGCPLRPPGENVDLYIPRKCAWTNRLIAAKDHASIQLNIGHLDDSGVYTGQYTTLALSGFVRAMVRAGVRAGAHA